MTTDVAMATERPSFQGRWLTTSEDMAPFMTDWRRRWTGRANAVAQPDSAADAAAIVQWCQAQGRPIVAQGGNAGLSGGATPDQSGPAVVLSLARLNRIRSIDAINETISVEAGCTLQQVQEAAHAAGRLFPLSLAAEGSCTIGGNLATNAGGVQVPRYGNARDICLGLEVVTAEGELWNGLRGLCKDNTGYDLRDLYIGSEGTLGIITGAVLKLYPLQARQTVAFGAIDSPDSALQLLGLARRHLGPALTACELVSDTCLELVLRHVPSARQPLPERAPWYVLLQVSEANGEGENASQYSEAMQQLLETALEQGLLLDAALSTTLAQFEALWMLRESVSESQGAEGKTIKHDISLPISAIARFLQEASEAVAKYALAVRLVVFGRLGAGILHFNVSPPVGGTEAGAFEALEGPLNRLVHDLMAQLGGSISAEHGLGVPRRDESQRDKSLVETQLMQRIKQALDPLGLLTPRQGALRSRRRCAIRPTPGASIRASVASIHELLTARSGQH